MTEMVDFSIAILRAISDWLFTPPIFYLFALLLFVPVIKIVVTLIRSH